MYILLWIIVLIGSLILEFITETALVSIWFTFGALVSLLLALFKISFTIQVIIFFIVSILALIIIRPLVKNYMRGNTIKTNADRVIGQNAKLLKEINMDQLGELKIFGTIWNCTSIDNVTIEKDSIVKIMAIEGSKLIVKKI